MAGHVPSYYMTKVLVMKSFQKLKVCKWSSFNIQCYTEWRGQQQPTCTDYVALYCYNWFDSSVFLYFHVPACLSIPFRNSHIFAEQTHTDTHTAAVIPRSPTQQQGNTGERRGRGTRSSVSLPTRPFFFAFCHLWPPPTPPTSLTHTLFLSLSLSFFLTHTRLYF